MAKKKKILYIVKVMGGGVFAYKVNLANKYAVKVDVFLLPSRREGFPILLLEYIYMKKVCVVSNVIGNRDVIHNGENSFVCAKVEDFVKDIEEWQSKDEELPEQIHQDILKVYNKKNIAQIYNKKYESALKERGGRYDLISCILIIKTYIHAYVISIMSVHYVVVKAVA